MGRYIFSIPSHGLPVYLEEVYEPMKIYLYRYCKRYICGLLFLSIKKTGGSLWQIRLIICPSISMLPPLTDNQKCEDVKKGPLCWPLQVT